MSDLLPPSVAIAIATYPPSVHGDYPSLIGVALFSAQEHGVNVFIYQLQVCTVRAQTTASELIKWMIPRLPAGRVTIGWQLADSIMPALLAAGDAATPTAAHDLVDALAAMVSIDAVDLVDRHGGVAAPPFDSLCAAADIPATVMFDSDGSDGPTFGREIDVTAALAADVIATWRLWARSQRPDDPAPQRFAADVLDQWRIDDEAIATWRRTDPS